MEDTLRALAELHNTEITEVLILVLMEDTLRDTANLLNNDLDMS